MTLPVMFCESRRVPRSARMCLGVATCVCLVHTCGLVLYVNLTTMGAHSGKAHPDDNKTGTQYNIGSVEAQYGGRYSGDHHRSRDLGEDLQENASRRNIVPVFKSLHKQVEFQDGFELSVEVNKLCWSQHLKTVGSMRRMFLSDDKSVLYCPVEKVATTFWKRAITMLPEMGLEYTDPYDVPIGKALQVFSWVSRFINRNAVPDDSFRFVFVRNPFSRLHSAFVDKFLAPNPDFWRKIGVKAILMSRNETEIRRMPNGYDINGSDVTFSELIRYATYSEKTGKDPDEHFTSIFKSCKPCLYNYNFIGRLESFHRDALSVLEKLQINTLVLRSKQMFRELFVEDAILDSIRVVFDWKDEIVRYIPWKEALQRVWLKLQLRGIIGHDKNLNISESELNDVTETQFLEMANRAHKASVRSDLLMQRKTAMQEAFSMVSREDIQAFVEAYRFDFSLFGYEDTLQ